MEGVVVAGTTNVVRLKLDGLASCGVLSEFEGTRNETRDRKRNSSEYYCVSKYKRNYNSRMLNHMMIRPAADVRCC